MKGRAEHPEKSVIGTDQLEPHRVAARFRAKMHKLMQPVEVVAGDVVVFDPGNYPGGFRQLHSAGRRD
jgi:ectoine hydroxylase-related dioxygenase (phytanoyl-CoA dioxygenase family)